MRCAVSLPFVYFENAIMLKKIVFAASCISLGTLVALAPQSNSAMSKSETSKPVAPVYEEGSVVTAYALENLNRKGQPIGRFVVTHPVWSLGALSLADEVQKFSDHPRGYEADAYFVAKTAGEYSFAAAVELPPTLLFTDPSHWQGEIPGWTECRYRLTVASETVIDLEADSRAQGTHDRACGLSQHGFGTIQLEAGMHRVRQWIACTGERDLKGPATQFVYPAGCPQEGMTLYLDSNPAKEASVKVRVRHPQENRLVDLTPAELVHEKR